MAHKLDKVKYDKDKAKKTTLKHETVGVAWDDLKKADKDDITQAMATDLGYFAEQVYYD